MAGGGRQIDLTDLEQLPAPFAYALCPIGSDLSVTTLKRFKPSFLALDDDGGLAGHLRLGIHTESAPEDEGVIEFTFDARSGISSLDLFYVPSLLIGGGHGKRAVARIARLIGALGIRYLDLTAQGIGKYLWANCGFAFIDEHECKRVNDACAILAVRLGVIDSPEDWEIARQPWEFAQILSDSNSVPLTVAHDHATSVLDALGTQARYALPAEPNVVLAKVLLTQADYKEWRGRLDLGCDKQVNVMNAYVRGYDEDHGYPTT
jgi:hypothetical protein